MEKQVYLALGDSMSIDYYTGIIGGGAVRQFFKSLGFGWRLIDKSFDGCTIGDVPTDNKADLITLTIGGNDGLKAIALSDKLRSSDVVEILNSHKTLLSKIRQNNPKSCLIVGNIYIPDFQLSNNLFDLLHEMNQGINTNVKEYDGLLADINHAFMGHEKKYLCRQIEPSLQGAIVISKLFREQYEKFFKEKII